MVRALVAHRESPFFAAPDRGRIGLLGELICAVLGSCRWKMWWKLLDLECWVEPVG